MSDILKVSIVQSDIFWEDKIKNLAYYTHLIESLSEFPDLLIFPEMFTTGFSNQPDGLAEEMDGATVTWMMKVAGKYNLFICGSLILKEKDNYFNRFVLVSPSGNLQYYDKRHLFKLNDEESAYTIGNERKIFSIGQWRVCPQICYDLRFPVWSRIVNDYDLLIYVANWPESRHVVWTTLISARAIENMSYCIGANRIGLDGNGISYIGESMIVNPKGQIVSNIEPGNEGIVTASLSLQELKKFRNSFPVLNDADKFKIEDN